MSNRNTILITADSVRADYTGFLNSALDTTPYLTELSDDAIVFENAIAPGPRTLSSVPAIFTGEQMSVPAKSPDDKPSRVDKINTHMRSFQSIAELFAENGYTTVGFIANPWINAATDFDGGFDVFSPISPPSYSDKFPFNIPYISPLYHTRVGEFYRHIMNLKNNQKWYSQWPTFYDRIVETMREIDEPFFLWVFLMDTHNPYIVPRTDRVESSTVSMYKSLFRSNEVLASDGSAIDESVPKSTELCLKKAYRDSIRSVDRFVETLHSEFDSADPVLIFHSDHGEAFGEHDTYGHKSEMYSENIRVPLLMHGLDDSRKIEETFPLYDLMGLLESSVIDDAAPAVESEYAISQDEAGDVFAIRDDDWKLILDISGSEPERRLYNLKDDPMERVDVAERHRHISDTLVDKLDEHTTEGEIETSDRDVDDSVKEHLESLGYK